MTRDDHDRSGGVPLTEILGVLSLATDFGIGRPPGNELRVTMVAMRFGRSLSLADELLRELLAVALLRWIGCTSHAHELASFFPDERAAQRRAAFIDFGSRRELIRDGVRHAGAGRPPLGRLQTVARVLLTAPKVTASSYLASCEVGAMLAGRIGLGKAVQRSLGAVFERWDGTGWPRGMSGEEIPLTARIVNIAQDAVNFGAQSGLEDAVEVLRRRSGNAHDPALVSPFSREAAGFLRGLEQLGSWEGVVECEPKPAHMVAPDRIDDALQAMADFADLKDPHTIGHSPGVAKLAAAAAQLLGLPPGDQELVRRAGLLHDLGRVGVANGVWEKPTRLTDPEWEQVRLHPYFAERATARCTALARYGELGATHHERLDGSGYHRGTRGPEIGMPSRVLAAADAYHAMTEERAHRPALDAASAKARLRDEVAAGRLDGQAVDAVLSAAGHRVRRARRDWPAGLSTREVEVLRHAVRGASNRQIAERLHISARTVEHHLSHAYVKIGVSSRAAAALFAAENNLLQD